MSAPRLIFWFDFASTYSYLSAMRVQDLARAAGVQVDWRPFLLGPIFAAQGWTNSPFNLYPAKGANMWRDMQRLCADRGLPFAQPDPFPQNSMLAARVATAIPDMAQRAAFCRAVYAAEFGQGAQISDPATLLDCLSAADLPATLLEAAQSPETKAALRQTTEDAQAAGIYGAPSFTVGDELFWGDDRLDQAMAWAQRPRT